MPAGVPAPPPADGEPSLGPAIELASLAPPTAAAAAISATALPAAPPPSCRCRGIRTELSAGWMASSVTQTLLSFHSVARDLHFDRIEAKSSNFLDRKWAKIK